MKVLNSGVSVCGLIFSPAAEFFWLNWPRSPGGIWQQCSMLGALGFSDEEVKAVGRWSSRAFEEYMLLPRTKRMQMAKLMKSL